MLECSLALLLLAGSRLAQRQHNLLLCLILVNHHPPSRFEKACRSPALLLLDGRRLAQRQRLALGLPRARRLPTLQ